MTRQKKETVSKKTTEVVVDKKPRAHRWRPGTVARREIRKFQQSNELLLRKLPFADLVRSITHEFHKDLRFQDGAFHLLQQSCERYVIRVLKCANELSCHAQRVTVFPRDILLAHQLTQ